MERVRADVAASTAPTTARSTTSRTTVSTATGTLVVATRCGSRSTATRRRWSTAATPTPTASRSPTSAGINPLKFGFDTQKKTYHYFDTDAQQGHADGLQGRRDRSTGVQVYKFVQIIAPTQIGALEVPGNLVGSTEPSVVAPRFYANIRTRLGRAGHRRDRQGRRAAEADPARRRTAADKLP